MILTETHLHSVADSLLFGYLSRCKYLKTLEQLVKESPQLSEIAAQSRVDSDSEFQASDLSPFVSDKYIESTFEDILQKFSHLRSSGENVQAYFYDFGSRLKQLTNEYTSKLEIFSSNQQAVYGVKAWGKRIKLNGQRRVRSEKPANANSATENNVQNLMKRGRRPTYYPSDYAVIIDDDEDECYYIPSSLAEQKSFTGTHRYLNLNCAPIQVETFASSNANSDDFIVVDAITSPDHSLNTIEDFVTPPRTQSMAETATSNVESDALTVDPNCGACIRRKHRKPQSTSQLLRNGVERIARTINEQISPTKPSTSTSCSNNNQCTTTRDENTIAPSAFTMNNTLIEEQEHQPILLDLSHNKPGDHRQTPRITHNLELDQPIDEDLELLFDQPNIYDFLKDFDLELASEGFDMCFKDPYQPEQITDNDAYIPQQYKLPPTATCSTSNSAIEIQNSNFGDENSMTCSESYNPSKANILDASEFKMMGANISSSISNVCLFSTTELHSEMAETAAISAEGSTNASTIVTGTEITSQQVVKNNNDSTLLLTTNNNKNIVVKADLAELTLAEGIGTSSSSCHGIPSINSTVVCGSDREKVADTIGSVDLDAESFVEVLESGVVEAWCSSLDDQHPASPNTSICEENSNSTSNYSLNSDECRTFPPRLISQRLIRSSSSNHSGQIAPRKDIKQQKSPSAITNSLKATTKPRLPKQRIAPRKDIQSQQKSDTTTTKRRSQRTQTRRMDNGKTEMATHEHIQTTTTTNRGKSQLAQKPRGLPNRKGEASGPVAVDGVTASTSMDGDIELMNKRKRKLSTSTSFSSVAMSEEPVISVPLDNRTIERILDLVHSKA